MPVLTGNFWAQEGPHNVADGAQTVATTLYSKGLLYVRITPSHAPDPGTPHELTFNGSTAVKVSDDSAYEVDLSHLSGQEADQFRITSVTVKAGKNATSFIVEGSL